MIKEYLVTYGETGSLTIKKEDYPNESRITIVDDRLNESELAWIRLEDAEKFIQDLAELISKYN